MYPHFLLYFVAKSKYQNIFKVGTAAKKSQGRTGRSVLFVAISFRNDSSVVTNLNLKI